MEFSLNLIEGNWLKSCVEIALAMIILFKVPILRIRISLFACAVISVIWHSTVPGSISAASFLVDNQNYPIVGLIVCIQH